MELKIGDKIRFKNMPITYPTGTVLEVLGETLKYKLDKPLTRMGYTKTEKLENPYDVDGKQIDYNPGFGEIHSKANTVIEGTCSLNDVERV